MGPELAKPKMGNEVNLVSYSNALTESCPLGHEKSIVLLPERAQVEQLAKMPSA